MLHRALPVAPWMAPDLNRLPGTRPLGADPWLIRDEAFAGQMALRDALIRERRAEVIAEPDAARDAAGELLAHVLAALDDGYVRTGNQVTRPDGVTVDLRADTPLATAGRLVQADLCLLGQAAPGVEPTLDAAVLCFPASWTLAEKIGRPLLDIHAPVASYGAQMARRVTRLFDGLKPGRPIWRQNALFYSDPALFAPRAEADPRVPAEGQARYVRSERQVLLKLPETRATVFAIHTYVLPIDALSGDQREALRHHPLDTADRMS